MSSVLGRLSSRSNHVNPDRYFPWIAQRRSLYSSRGTDRLSSRANAVGALARSPGVERTAPNPITSLSRAGRTLAGGRHGAAVARSAKLKPTPPSILASRRTDSVPSAADISARSNLAGEDGPVAYRTMQRARVASVTTPRATAPSSMGVSRPCDHPAAYAVSTQHLPSSDPTLPARLIQRDQQLPSTAPYRGMDRSLSTAAKAGAGVTNPSAAGALPPRASSREPRAPKAPRSIFREDG